MAAKDLITLDRAYANLSGVSGVDGTIASFITAASGAVEKYCRRHFYVKSYDELYNGGGDRRLLLREYPVQSVQSVRYRPVTVLKIINSATTQNQQARVQVTSTGVQLTRVASGVLTTETLLTFATYPTLTAMATQINTLGNGWSAQYVGDQGQAGGQGDYGLWPSADLYIPTSYSDGLTSQGNLTARGTQAELKMHTYELSGYQFDPRGWLLRAIPYTDPELLHPEDLVWPTGINNFRIQYTAGYSTVPEAVQEACAEWVSYLYYLTLRDPALRTQAVSGALNQSWEGPAASGSRPPPNIVTLLAPYRRHTVATNQG